MEKELDAGERDILEGFIDAYGIKRVLGALSDISSEKADHVRTTWQDEGLAKAHEKNARIIDKALAQAETL